MWKTRLVPEPQSHPERMMRRIGDYWLAERLRSGPEAEHFKKHILSPIYLEHDIKYRPPIMIVLPTNFTFCLDQRWFPSDKGWTLSGVMTAITANPSIWTPNYHGYLMDGVLSADIEGRLYDE